MYPRRFIGINGLHEIDLDAMRALPQERDIFIHVLPGARVVAVQRESQGVHPEGPQFALVQPADGDLLNAENSEGSVTHGCLFSR